MSRNKNKKLIALEIEEGINTLSTSPKQKFKQIVGERPWLKYKNDKQKAYATLIETKEITICTGPAGTGKSMISLAKALDLIWQDDNNYEHIVIIKPVVEAGESLGFLPGEKDDKLLPYVYSSLYLIEKMIGESACQKLLDEGIIKLQALAYLRGVNFDNSLIIMEEAQNTTISQMKTLLTRLGEDSKIIVSGDLEQSDRFEESQISNSGLYESVRVLKAVEEIGIFEFNVDDVVRNALVSKIIKQFNRLKMFGS